MMIRYIIVLAGLLAACSPVSKTALNKKFRALEVKLQDHTGFMLYDLDKKKELYAFQEGQYFTPASNTKIFTLYTSLTILGDSIPALRYAEKGDSLIFKGTGDPSFLYKNVLESGKTYDFLAGSSRQLYLMEDNFFTTALGPGWAWSDYNYSYSVEPSALPVYGNFFSSEHSGQALKITPQIFAYEVTVADSTEECEIVREIGSNKINFHPGRM